MSRPFTAKYRGRCYECSDAVEVGDEIVWAGDDTRMVSHAGCAEAVEVAAPRPGPPPCPHCWTVHAGECL